MQRLILQDPNQTTEGERKSKTVAKQDEITNTGLLQTPYVLTKVERRGKVRQKREQVNS